MMCPYHNKTELIHRRSGTRLRPQLLNDSGPGVEHRLSNEKAHISGLKKSPARSGAIPLKDFVDKGFGFILYDDWVAEENH